MDKRLLVSLLAAGMVFVALVPLGSALEEEGRAALPIKAPKWAVNDHWSWKTDRTVKLLSTYTDVNGTLTIVYIENDQSIKDTVLAVEAARYKIAFQEREWLNGSWNYKPSPAGEANGWLESNGSIRGFFDRSGVRYRSLSDFSLVNASVKMAYHYGCQRLDGNYRLFNWSGNETHDFATDIPLNSLKFPLTPGDSWGVNTNLTDSYQGVKEWPEYPQWGTSEYSGSRYDHYIYTVTVAQDPEWKLVPAGSLECYRLTDLGYDDWGWTEGSASGQGSTAMAQDRWWSRDAGTTANTNDTTKLESYVHVANLPPSISVIPTQLAREDQPFSMELAPYAVDPDVANDTGDFLTFNATCTPAIPDFELNATTGRLTVTPAQAHVGAHAVALTVTDSFGLKAYRNFGLNVANVNNPPYVAHPIANVSMQEYMTLMTDIFLNWVFSDPDPAIMDSLSYSVHGNGSVAADIGPDTRLTLTAPDLFAPLAPIMLTFIATDTGSGNESAVAEAAATLNLTIIHRNHRPAAAAIQNITFDEDMNYTALDLSSAFSDVDISYAGDSLNYSFSGNKRLTVTLQGSLVTLTPDANWNGEENITFTATDSAGQGNSSAVNVKVRPVNDPPSVQANGTSPDLAPQAIPEARNGTLSELRFNLNATDVDGDKLTIGWSVSDQGGRKVGEGKGAAYVFKAAYIGDLSSSGGPYTVSALIGDGKENVTVNWTVTVTNVDRRPSAVISAPADGAKFTEKKTVLLDGSKSADEDQPAAGLKYEWTSSLNGKLGTSANLTVKDLKKGTHIITLVVTDPEGESSNATVTVKVVAAAAPPKGFIPGFGASLAAAALAAVLLARPKRGRG